MKKIQAIIMLCCSIFWMLFLLSSCGEKDISAEAPSDTISTLTGQVSAVEESSITLLLGELSEDLTFTPSTETAAFLLTDSTVITVEDASGQSREGSREDIVVNAIVVVELEDEQTASSVIVKS